LQRYKLHANRRGIFGRLEWHWSMMRLVAATGWSGTDGCCLYSPRPEFKKKMKEEKEEEEMVLKHKEQWRVLIRSTEGVIRSCALSSRNNSAIAVAVGWE